MYSRIGDLEKKYVLEALESQFRSSKGAVFMQRLEKAFSSRFGVKYGVSCINGTATMHSALEAMGIGIGDEVIVPPLTMSATAFCVLETGATPIFADVDASTFQISAESIKQRITKDTKAIITVALYGMCPEMDDILKICSENNLKLIEDNAENFLGTYKGNLVGTFGDAASFSFQSSKHLTSGEGGIVLTNQEDLANRIRRVNSLGYAGVGASKAKISKLDIQSPDYDRHVSMGWNYRMPELCCAVALARVERIDELVQKRVNAALKFKEAVDNSEILVGQYTPDYCTNSYWTYVAKLDEGINWYEFRKKFLDLGGHGFYSAWKLSYQEPMFKDRNLLNREQNLTRNSEENYQEGSCPIAENLQTRLVQFKTNYWNEGEADSQAEILIRTLNYFN